MMRHLFTILLSVIAANLLAATPSYIMAHFTQTKECMMLNQTIVTTGVMTYNAPDQISWVYDDGVTAQLPQQMLTFIRKAVAGEVTTKNLPKQVKQFFSDIQIDMDETTNVARKVVLYEVNGDITTITFQDVQKK